MTGCKLIIFIPSGQDVEKHVWEVYAYADVQIIFTMQRITFPFINPK